MPEPLSPAPPSILPQLATHRRCRQRIPRLPGRDAPHLRLIIFQKPPRPSMDFFSDPVFCGKDRNKGGPMLGSEKKRVLEFSKDFGRWGYLPGGAAPRCKWGCFLGVIVLASGLSDAMTGMLEEWLSGRSGGRTLLACSYSPNVSKYHPKSFHAAMERCFVVCRHLSCIHSMSSL